MFKNPDEILKALTKRIRKPPSPSFWQGAIKECWVENILEATDPDTEAEEFEQLIQRWKTFEGNQASTTNDLQPLPSPREPDPTLGALSLIFAADAKWMPEVVRFRRRVLGGVGVPLDRVGKWIEEQIAKQGPPTVQVSQARGPDGTPLPTGKILRFQALSEFPPALDLPSFVPEAVLTELAEIQDAPDFPGGDVLHEISALEVAHADPNLPGVAWSFRVETLKITDHPVVPINVEGILGALKNLARHLTKALGFDEAGWALYLLSHNPPIPDLAVVNIATGPVPPLDQVTIQASPLLGSKQLSALYSEARNSLANYEKNELYTPYTFDHPISDKHIRLAIFVAQKNDGRTWDEAMSRWNDTYPKYPYTEVRNFGRDGRAAYQRVTGIKLRWKRRVGKAHLSKLS